ncbi:uncharacterized protein [Phyllobates terribilis]|uniref:uncharacterized protein n=1 Tax=Phyllobates terribilis TaxID=111132 RepID=UPI003CCAE0A3
MGKVVEKTKKKKGRPSLLDLQKRNLKQQQEEELRRQQLEQQQQLRRSHKIQNPNPNNTPTPIRRSTRRNPNPDSGDDEAAYDAADDDADQSTGKRRKEKKIKLVSKLPDSSVNSDSLNSGSNSNLEEEDDASASLKKRRIEAIGDRSGQRKDDKVVGCCFYSTLGDDGPSTPLPDKKLLLFILDRLQKKDTYGVYADPVDPEELPDYHEVIKHPMDFSTLRKKLTNGAYVSLEQFEKDVFLLCSNAMQYNAPDTIYFRQARSIQELAMKNFENLRQESDDNEPEIKVVRRGRPPTKHLKRPVGRPPLERVVSDSPSATLATAGESSTRPNNNDTRKANNTVDRYASPDPFGRMNYGSRQGEVYISWSADKYNRADEIIGSMKHGKKVMVGDENRRNTYECTLGGVQDSSSAFGIFQGQHKHLVPVGLQTEYGYAEAWRGCSEAGARSLEGGFRKDLEVFGSRCQVRPGWVVENDLESVRPNSSSATPPESNDMKSCPVVQQPLRPCVNGVNGHLRSRIESAGPQCRVSDTWIADWEDRNNYAAAAGVGIAAMMIVTPISTVACQRCNTESAATEEPGLPKRSGLLLTVPVLYISQVNQSMTEFFQALILCHLSNAFNTAHEKEHCGHKCFSVPLPPLHSTQVRD